MSNQPVDQSRRTWVTMACAAGGVGGVATMQRAATRNDLEAALLNLIDR